MIRAAIVFFQGDEGQGLAEYALLLALIAMVSVLLVARLGHGVAQTFRATQKALPRS